MAIMIKDTFVTIMQTSGNNISAFQLVRQVHAGSSLPFHSSLYRLCLAASKTCHMTCKESVCYIELGSSQGRMTYAWQQRLL